MPATSAQATSKSAEKASHSWGQNYLSGEACGIQTSTTITYDDPSMAKTTLPNTGLKCSLPASGKIVPATSGDYGSYSFTQDQPFFSAADSNGSFYAQVTYSSSPLPVAFGFTLSQYLQSIAASDVTPAVYEFKGSTSTGCYYGGKPYPIDYQFHWSCPQHDLNYQYHIAGSFTFRVDVGGRMGTAVVNIQFTYVISVNTPRSPGDARR